MSVVGMLYNTQLMKYAGEDGVAAYGKYTDVKESLPNYIFMNFGENSASGFGLEPMQEFVQDIVDGNEFRTSAYDGLQASRIAAAVHQSAETGEIVTLD